jgi:hypothetical protein
LFYRPVHPTTVNALKVSDEVMPEKGLQEPIHQGQFKR